MKSRPRSNNTPHAAARAGGVLFFFASSMALGLAGTAAADLPVAEESLNWKPDGFVLVHREKTGWKGVRGNETWRHIYAKPGVTAQNWTEKAEVTELPIAITLGGRVRWNPESVMNAEKARAEKQRCPTDAWTVIHQDGSSILWEWQKINCPGYLHQHEIVRIVMGRWYLWTISYAIRNRELSDDEKAALIKDLMSAKVVQESR